MESRSLIKKYATTLLLLLVVIGCNSKSEEKTEKEVEINYVIIDVDSFNERVANEPTVQLIDVRTKGEYDSGSIPKAVNYDLLDGTFEKNLDKLDKSKPVYLFCAKGGRSGKASAILEKNGFSEIIDLKGGYTAWQANEKK